jgi:opacity protein-like surface antigen
MGRRLAVLLGLAVALLAGGPAFANGKGDRDIPAPIPVPAPVPIPESFSYYLRADLGYGLAGDPSFSESGATYGSGLLTYSGLSNHAVSSDDVLFGSVGGGVYFSPHWRGDITLDFRGAQDIDATATYVDAPNNGFVKERIRLRGTVALVNAYWDFLPRGAFSPYVGAGIGFVYNHIERSHLTQEDTAGVPPLTTENSGSSSASNVGLAAALMAGVTFAWDHRWALDVSYRALYLDGADVTTTLTPSTSASSVDVGSQWEHQFRVGLRANIW